MFDKINIKGILKAHFSTLVDDSSGNKDFIDYFLFYIMPFFLSLFLIFVYDDLKSIARILIMSLSIFTGLLFSLMLLTYDLVKRNEEQGIKESKETELKTKTKDDIALKGKILKQIFNNISYSILVAIFSIISLLLIYIWNNPIYKFIVEFSVYFLVINFFLTLLMVLKRTHKLLSNEF